MAVAVEERDLLILNLTPSSWDFLTPPMPPPQLHAFLWTSSSFQHQSIILLKPTYWWFEPLTAALLNLTKPEGSHLQSIHLIELHLYLAGNLERSMHYVEIFDSLVVLLIWISPLQAEPIHLELLAGYSRHRPNPFIFTWWQPCDPAHRDVLS